MPQLSSLKTRSDVRRYIDTMTTSVDCAPLTAVLRWLRNDALATARDTTTPMHTRRVAKTVVKEIDRQLGAES